tara:strand:- start:423 stop:548 length:126 start_codon:yes stop_codon:yes gene_type:complete
MMNQSIANCIATLRIRDDLDGWTNVVLQAVEHWIITVTKIG